MEQKQTCTPQERAKAVELAIWKAIDEGHVKLTHGVYQDDTMTPGVCRACAVGSAARAICGTRSAWDKPLRKALEDKGVMSEFESCAMEQGFEASAHRSASAAYNLLAGIFWLSGANQDAFEPFFDLGVRLRARKRPEGL